jgi:hypothetical protein
MSLHPDSFSSAAPLLRLRRTTFAVHDEGDGVLGLQAGPWATSVLAHALLRTSAASRLHEVDGRGLGTVPIALGDLIAARDIELVDGPIALEGSVLADPQAALQGGRFAFAAADDAHGTLYTRDQQLLREALRCWVVAVTGTDAVPLDDDLLAPLLNPIAPEQWIEVRCDRGSRVWTMRIQWREVDADGETITDEETRWVGGPGKRWRDGWSW